MTRRGPGLLNIAALVIGVGLLAATAVHVDFRSIGELARQLGIALPIALLPSAAWHFVRTAAWRQCFAASDRPPFGRALRVRLAAEAFSFVTIRGVAGEPLKVSLLAPDTPTAVSAAAVALERAAYIVTTAVILSVSAFAAATALPLTLGWMRVFGLIALLSAILIAALLYVLLRNRSDRRGPMPPRGTGRRSFIARFVRELEAQLRSLAFSDRRRLAGLLALEASAYVLMALEVWAVLRASGTPISAADAMAVETLTRAASMASAFIPANIGALEASNVAAATAVHAAGGAAALALVRRVRGLLWCAAGFLIYPRPGSRSRPRGETLVVIEEPGSDPIVGARLAGLPIGERLARAAARAGYTHLLVWAPRQKSQWLKIAERARSRCTLIVVADDVSWRGQVQTLDQSGPVTVVTSGILPAPALLEVMRRSAPTDLSQIAKVPGGVLRTMPAQLHTPTALAGRLRPSASPPQGLRVARRQQLAQAERDLRASVFKPTDGVAGRFNRRLSIPLSVALIRWTRLSPNVMTVLLIALGMYSGWLFARGTYGTAVLAALISLAASILDGCDGELARLQYKDSSFGCWLDTLGDYTYYLAIFSGMTIGLVRQTGSIVYWWIGGALLVGCLLTFALLIVLRQRATNGQPERLRSTAKAHFYATGSRWAQTAARLSTYATRAAMPWGLLALAAAGLLPVMLTLAALAAQLYWLSLALEFQNLLDPVVALRTDVS
jgi:phosphatidylglycerophosphate synthase